MMGRPQLVAGWKVWVEGVAGHGDWHVQWRMGVCDAV